MAFHLVPVNDLKEHDLESTCECCPKLIMVDDEMIFAHNSYDGRELVEELLAELNGDNEKEKGLF